MTAAQLLIELLSCFASAAGTPCALPAGEAHHGGAACDPDPVTWSDKVVRLHPRRRAGALSGNRHE